MNYLSIDSETYGSCEYTWDLRPLPRQTVFHPERSLQQDLVSLEDLVLSYSITVAVPNSTVSRAHELSTLQPKQTMVLYTHLPHHRKLLRQWLGWADILIGRNIQFDLLYGRRLPWLRPSLTGRHTLIDGMALTIMHYEGHKDLSLKAEGPALGKFSYNPEETLRDGKRFPNPLDLKFRSYSAQDSHNAILAAQERAARILQDHGPPTPASSGIEAFGSSSKLSDYSIRYWSDVIYECLRLSENGIPFDAERLRSTHAALEAEVTTSEARLLTEFDLPLPGSGVKGQKEKQQAFLTKALQEIDSLGLSEAHGVSTIYQHPLLQYTPKTKELSFSVINRQLCAALLPKDHPLQEPLSLADSYTTAHNRLSRWTYPLLHRRRSPTAKAPHNSLLLKDPSCSTRTPTSSAASVPSPVSSSSGPASDSSSSASSATSLPPPQPPSDTNPCVTPESTASSSSVSTPSLAESSPPPSSTASTSCTSSPASKIGIAYCSWYPFPSSQKDGAGGDGGQKQARPSATNPAIQQADKLIKSHFKSRFPRGLIISYDLSQIELRVQALLTRDPTLCAAYSPPPGQPTLDLHTERAIRIYGREQLESLYPELTDQPSHTWKKLSTRWQEGDERFGAKTANFGGEYGARAAKMQQIIFKESDGRVLLPLHICSQIVASRAEMYPGAVTFQQSLLSFVARTGRLYMPFSGHSRDFLGFSTTKNWEADDQTNEIFNNPNQTLAAVALHRIFASMPLPPLNAHNPPYLPFANIYDALYFDVRSKAHVSRLDSDFAFAVNHVEHSEYWHWLESIFGHRVPLAYDRTPKDLP